MATNTKVDSRQTVRVSITDLAFDGNGQATVTVPELRQVDGPEDVVVEGYSVGGNDTDAAYLVCESVGTDNNGVLQLTLHIYDTTAPTAGNSFGENTSSVTVNNVFITAEGL